MKSYTVHLRQTRPPVLVREGFSIWAMIFGPLWLLQKRAWWAALVLALVWIAVRSVHWTGEPVLVLALTWLQGLFALDMYRCNLAMRGYDLSFVVIGHNEQSALARLLGEYPGLRSRMAQ